jgi:hypothetical protein
MTRVVIQISKELWFSYDRNMYWINWNVQYIVHVGKICVMNLLFTVIEKNDDLLQFLIICC